MSTHTYLLQEGQWQASGIYYDHRGHAMPISGLSIITHEEESWFNHCQMQLETTPPIGFSNLYDIEPLDPGMETTIWETEHASLGLIMGTLVVINDVLIMSYMAEGGYYSGTETLRQVDADHYQNWGVLWQGDQKVSSWSASLVRIVGPKA